MARRNRTRSSARTRVGNLDVATCERARVSRDRRFDGRFFSGVRTTRIYCRPVCPVRPAKAENVSFYPSAAAAERSEEHTSELQSPCNLVCRLLLDKKNPVTKKRLNFQGLRPFSVLSLANCSVIMGTQTRTIHVHY